ncbi:PaaI family thioesterase [Notoacmeibacter sp. MSK16QG-6]|uniref:PaaI family thioesterase n=1 Tax=Notoacmeibacter sp. MSK16QG-6 TaxID=2957982 RepID=UPI00209D7C40|nr:PaaI family thioesterase [Notoacmeibacter sp. MSK16QG-6]MCP1198291.1 PaaI family thioesterase [Notoacmeibacter sp. MSK16QG-6]
MSDRPTRSLDEMPPPSNFSEHLGIQVTKCVPEEVVCRMIVTEEMANRNGVLHGGALMTLADTAAGTCAFINSPVDISNTTVEAKTNFIRPARVGDTLTARCEALHVGRATLVLQVTIARDDGKTVGVTSQTHLFLGWKD